MSARRKLAVWAVLAVLSWGLLWLVVLEPRILMWGAGLFACRVLYLEVWGRRCQLFGLHDAGRRFWYTAGGVRREVETCPRCGHREVLSEEEV